MSRSPIGKFAATPDTARTKRTFLILALCALALVPGAAGRTEATKPLLGIKGDAGRFKDQTGQESSVRHALLGWDQGRAWGSPFRTLLPTLAPIPMLHLGTESRPGSRREAITPRQIAQGVGDGYLKALNQAVSEWTAQIYIRPLAEMNGHWNLYSAFNKNGSARPADHSTAWFKKAFKRIYLIVHGGNVQTINARLAAIGLPPVTGELASNPAPRTRVIWNPQGYGSPNIPANTAQSYYPGDPFVDVVGNDLYDQNGKAEWAANDRLYAAHPGKPYSFPEWGLWGIDHPTFIERMCAFVKTHARVQVLAYFESVPGSVFDLGTKPKSRAAYKKCITPLGGGAAGGGAPTAGTPPTPANKLSLTADPATGDAPLAVSFEAVSTLPKIVRWQLAFGDGKVAQGDGEPPGTVEHTYAADGVYDAVLIVYQAPPFTGTAIRFLTHASVKVGEDAGVLMSLKATPASGKAPLQVSFRAVANPPRPVVSWQFLPGDGSSRSGEGKPPRFLGFTYKTRGNYRAILIVYLSPQFTGTATRLLTFADVKVR